MNDIQLKSKTDLTEHIKKCEPEFIHLIQERLGIVVHKDQTKELYKIISAACHKFNCMPKDYLFSLKNNQQLSPLLEHLVAGITIKETYFFRDKRQMHLLQEVLLPEIIQKKRQQNQLNLRIWSAGCATGEEIYTIAMLLNEMLPDIDHWTINLLGSDINTHVLQKAKLGYYDEWSMRSIANHFKQHYFSYENKRYLLSKKIRELVSFEYLNLVEDSYPSMFNGTNAQDLIICRNVLIYFDSAHVAQLIRNFSASLIEEGYLLLGASDPIPPIEELELIPHYDKGMLFSRGKIKDRLKEKIRMPITSQANLKSVKESVSLLKQPLAKLNAKHLDVAATTAVDQNLITQLLNDGHWTEILDLIETYGPAIHKSVFLINAKATALANIGKLVEAAHCCEESLKVDATNKNSYFTFALISLELSHLDKAEVALRKALFLDNQFVAGHFQLGLLLLKNKQRELGIKSLRNALTIAKAQDPNQAVLGFQGLYYGRLAEILKQEIDLYSV